MKTCSYCLLILLIIFSLKLYAQDSEVYLPKEFRSAVQNKTRSLTGVPGPNYWQNSSDYVINAEVLPERNLLKGSAKITYHNNSPDSLNIIVLRLYQNILKPQVSRDWELDPSEMTDGVVISLLIVESDTLISSSVNRGVDVSNTNMEIKLDNLLPPAGSVKLEVNWEFQIAKKNVIRMGDYGEGNMFIAYWYPQIAVYDDIDGWDKINYGGSVEFYNDFNNYDFSVTLPGNYVMWATGELVNAGEVYQQPVLDRLNIAKVSDTTVTIYTGQDHRNKSVTLNNEKNTWKFKAVNVCDISFCLSDNYTWDAASVEVEPGRRALTTAAYKDSTVNFEHAAQDARATIEYLSKEIPGFPYPYPHATVFSNGRRGGGMETPMMANDGAPVERMRAFSLIFHEIAHTYFPFIIGANERKYAWMDEGWASILPVELQNRMDPEYDALSSRIWSYESIAGEEAEFPPMLLSYSNKGKHGRTAHYNRPAIAYYQLSNLLGRDLFQKALLEYFERWSHKHPLPYDFFNTIEEVAEEDLDWFWNPWFAEHGYPDLSLTSVRQNGSNINITIEKIGNIPVPIDLRLVFEDKSEKFITESAYIWKDGRTGIVLNYKSDKKLIAIGLDSDRIPDSDRSNNYIDLSNPDN
jgi:hypothetical protein